MHIFLKLTALKLSSHFSKGDWLIIRDRKNMWKNKKYFFTYLAIFGQNKIFCQKSHIFQIFPNIFQYFFNILVIFQYFGTFSDILYFFQVMQLRTIKLFFETFNKKFFWSKKFFFRNTAELNQWKFCSNYVALVKIQD